MLYFGYGSNLHRLDFEAWCRRRGHRPEGLRAVAPAWLPDAEPVFHYRSRVRGGGALSFRERRGAAIPGVLFDVDEDGWRALDEKEGRPTYYDRCDVVVLTPDGEERRAITYRVVDAHRRGDHVPPTAEYARLVCEGLAAHGLPQDQLLAAARALEVPALPRHVFVYGTLMRGELRHPMIARHRPARLRDATAAGRLLHLGEYPGMVPCDRGGRVRGELCELQDPADALVELDEVEDFLGYGVAGSLYRRCITEVDAGGERVHAWTYRYIGPADRAEPIPSNHWPTR